jgi:general stress protein YciG
MSDISETAAAMGRKGGQSTSEAKRQAVRENGKKGGRPKGGKNKPK